MPAGAVCPLLIRYRPHFCNAVNDVGGPPGLMQCSKNLHFMDWRLASAYVPRSDGATGVNFCKLPAVNADTLAERRRQDVDRCLKVPRIMPLLELL
jgi:hypothetical protein